MDIVTASNLERFVYDVVGRKPDEVCRLWCELGEKGTFDLSSRLSEFNITSGCATQAQVLETIRSVHCMTGGVIIDPHTAVGVSVAVDIRDTTPEQIIIAETAQPAKFEDTIYEALGVKPKIPESFRELEQLPERTFPIDPDPEAVKAFIREHAS
jgi:threonine synthase